MKIAGKAYKSDLINKRSMKNIMKKLKRDLEVEGYYIIYYHPERKNLFELIESSELSKDYYKEQNLIIVGIALDEEDAFEMVKCMVQDLHQSGSSLNDRSYFA